MEYKLYTLIGKGKERSFYLDPTREYIVGRHSENDIVIQDKHISRDHFKISINKGRYYITDLHSKNGTFVNGRNLVPGEKTEVKEGVPILIGTTILGLGELSESCLKQFLVSTGFALGSDEPGIENDAFRVFEIKNDLQFIYNISNKLMDCEGIDEIAEKLLDDLFDFLMKIDRCVFILFDHETGEVSNIIYRSKKPGDDPDKMYNRDLVEHAVLINRPVSVKDCDNIEYGDEKFTESLQLMKIRSAMCVPISGSFGTIGAIYVDSLEMPNGFRENDVFILKDVCGRAGLVMDKILLERSVSLELDNISP